jgi:hypothetical protein
LLIEDAATSLAGDVTAFFVWVCLSVAHGEGKSGLQSDFEITAALQPLMSPVPLSTGYYFSMPGWTNSGIAGYKLPRWAKLRDRLAPAAGHS